MRTDANRFGLVVFSPPLSKKNAYDVNWLYRDKDYQEPLSECQAVLFGFGLHARRKKKSLLDCME
jgi:hypothetical protein